MISRIRFMRSCFIILPFFWFYTNAFCTEWKFEIAPYLWATKMSGKASIGPTTFNVNQNFSDIVKKLDIGGMLYATAHKEKLGFYFNGIYTVLSDDGQFNTVNIHVKDTFGIFGGGISYIVFERNFSNGSKISLEPYAGFRFTMNNTTLSLNNFSAKKNVDWTDPVVGLRLDYLFNKKWSASLTGDIGGINAASQYSYSAGAFLGFKPNKWQYTKMYLGYRILDQHYQTGQGRSFYNWNMKLFGPVLGFGFNF